MLKITPLNQMSLTEQRFILNKLGANIGELPAHLLTKAIEDSKHLIVEDESIITPSVTEDELIIKPSITPNKTRTKRTKEVI